VALHGPATEVLLASRLFKPYGMKQSFLRPKSSRCGSYCRAVIAFFQVWRHGSRSQEYTRHLNEARMERRAATQGYRSEFDRMNRDLDRLVQATACPAAG
jgi:hypothetical protein